MTRVYTTELIRKLIAIDRELDAAASPGPWRHSHSTILRDPDEIVAAMWVPRQHAYNRQEIDPTTEFPNARFIVHSRRALSARADIIEQLLARIAELENLKEMAR